MWKAWKAEERTELISQTIENYLSQSSAKQPTSMVRLMSDIETKDKTTGHQLRSVAGSQNYNMGDSNGGHRNSTLNQLLGR